MSRRIMGMLLPYLALAGSLEGWGDKTFSSFKEHRKCALPGCEVNTGHGYCCADHCKEHKLRQRKERQELCNRKT